MIDNYNKAVACQPAADSKKATSTKVAILFFCGNIGIKLYVIDLESLGLYNKAQSIPRRSGPSTWQN